MERDAGFTPWHGPGVDYEGGILHNSARVAIHAAHPPGAVAHNGLAALWPASIINLDKVNWRAN
jgi:hypothetical protein